MARTKSPNLRQLRQNRGLKLRDGAKALKISEASLSRIERGHYDTLPLHLAVRIRDLYGVPVDAWVDGK